MRKSYTPELLERIATRFKVLGEPMRLAILNVLRGGEHTVSDIVEQTGASQANVSKHLALLLRERLAARRKEGLNAWYRIADDCIFELCETVCDSLEADVEQERAVVARGRAARGRRPAGARR